MGGATGSHQTGHLESTRRHQSMHGSSQLDYYARPPQRPPLLPPTLSLSRDNSASTRPWIAGSLADTECVAQCLRDGDAVTRCRQSIKNVMTQLKIKRPTMRTEREKMQADLCGG